jgi:hypothetical protein
MARGGTGTLRGSGWRLHLELARVAGEAGHEAERVARVDLAERAKAFGAVERVAVSVDAEGTK